MRFRFGCRVIAVGTASIAPSACLVVSPVVGQQAETAPRYTSTGQLLAPVGYESWIFVGSNLGLGYRADVPDVTAAEGSRNDHKVFHNVYINPAAYETFKKSQQFPDPTMLVMEVFAAAERGPQDVVSAGQFNGDRIGIEVAVKNSRRPDGSTTPWAYYDFTGTSNGSESESSATAFPDGACESCHRRHAGPDNVWVRFYPVLRMFLPAFSTK